DTYNAAVLLESGEAQRRYYKHALPNYGVFDEKRHFTSDSEPLVFSLHGVSVGVTICEDIWFEHAAKKSCEAGAQVLVSLNASPFDLENRQQREAVMRDRVNAHGVPILYVNQVGGQDEIVFDGHSLAMDSSADVVLRMPQFAEALAAVTVSNSGELSNIRGDSYMPLSDLDTIYAALVCGVRDYVNKNGFAGAVIGLSGGIDSALTLAIAVDALGAENVQAVMMPFEYTSQMSRDDAAAQAQTLGVEYSVIPIADAYHAFTTMLEPEFEGLGKDTTEENIQARCRGLLLMAISNKKRRIVLTTGNKSEMAVGYATLYGDMAGGFAPFKDVPKIQVYALAERCNARSGQEVIPQRVIDRPPSAELAPDQVDQDSLPPYDVLDDILARYIEDDWSVDEIADLGHDRDTVVRVIRMVVRNEYKRRQAPPGVRVSKRAFGRDRRYPITSGYERE
ncbi:MAG: NAD+ synthase, partial [Pseudomonadota bacterium]